MTSPECPVPRPDLFDPVVVEMIERAAAVIAESGFEAARTKEFATPNASEGKFFKHFGTKKGVLRAICDFMWISLHARATEIEKNEPDPVTRIRKYLELYVSFYAEHEHICRVVATNTYPRDKLPDEGNHYHNTFQTLVLRSLVAVRRAGKLCDPDIPVAFVYHALRGSVSILLNQCYIEKHIDNNVKPSFTIDDVAKHVGDVLRGFLKVPGSTITEEIGKELGQYRATIQTAKTHLDALEQLEKRLTQTIASENSGDGSVRRGPRHAKTGTEI